MPFFRYGELPLVLLGLLSEGAKSGYELMATLERLFAPRYSASPGSVYPALSALEAEGLVKVEAPGPPKRYRTSHLGAQALRERLEDLVEIERRTGALICRQDSVDGELERLTGLVRRAKRLKDPATLVRILRSAQRQVEKA